MSSNTPVIVLASPKGGVGKTTASLVLASEFSNQFDDIVTIIDADPNYPFKHWQSMDNKPDNIEIILDESEETILDNIEKAKRQSKAVIIDLEGTKNMRVTYAVSQADLVVIPVQGSTLDANEAVEAIKLIKRTEKGFNKEIDFAILFTRMPAAITSRNLADIAKQFREAQIPMLPSPLVEREAFKTMFATGRTLYQLTLKQVSGLEKAKKDAYDFAAGVIKRVSANRNSQSKVA
jgi:chromosome partitioning protein